MTTVREVLERGRRRIESGWTQKAFARDIADRNCASYSIAACKVCAWGAIGGDVIMKPGPAQVKRDAMHALMRVLPVGYASVPYFNDQPTTTQADVLALYDRAIASLT